MAKVKYLGAMDHRHRANATGTEYMFHIGVFTEVKPEDATHYAERAARGSPWEVDFGIVEKTTEAIKDAVKPKNRYGGKK